MSNQAIKAQLKYTTGRHDITCPDCQKPASARVSGFKKATGRRFREVKATCRHCGSFYSFIW